MSSQKYLSMVEYPPRAERRGIEGVGLLQVTLNRQGEVLDWNNVQPTGNPLLDREIERVARRVTQLEPLPAIYPLDEASFVAPFSFLLR